MMDIKTKQNEQLLTDFWIELDDNRIPMCVDEACDCFDQSIHGTIYGALDCDAPEVKVGRIELVKIDLIRAAEANMSAFQLLDEIDQDTHCFGQVLLDTEYFFFHNEYSHPVPEELRRELRIINRNLK